MPGLQQLPEHAVAPETQQMLLLMQRPPSQQDPPQHVLVDGHTTPDGHICWPRGTHVLRTH